MQDIFGTKNQRKKKKKEEREKVRLTLNLVCLESQKQMRWTCPFFSREVFISLKQEKPIYIEFTKDSFLLRTIVPLEFPNFLIGCTKKAIGGTESLCKPSRTAVKDPSSAIPRGYHDFG